MGARKKSPTLRITVCAMLTALGVVALLLGSLLDSLDLSAAAIASVLCIYAVIEIGGSAPWLIWLATALLGLVLLPQKSPAAFYLFIGCYPILKEKLEKLPRHTGNLLKALCFAVMVALSALVLLIFFPTELLYEKKWMTIGVAALGYATLWLYDFALSRLITFYLVRLRNRLGLKWKK
ncbi:MAG: hypothetical protein E7620_07040 [Ruminococcaceae bacterium]|nr:hypothetical protein [Oscillospiraceae bacterium]